MPITGEKISLCFSWFLHILYNYLVIIMRCLWKVQSLLISIIHQLCTLLMSTYNSEYYNSSTWNYYIHGSDSWNDIGIFNFYKYNRNISQHIQNNFLLLMASITFVWLLLLFNFFLIYIVYCLCRSDNYLNFEFGCSRL